MKAYEPLAHMISLASEFGQGGSGFRCLAFALEFTVRFYRAGTPDHRLHEVTTRCLRGSAPCCALLAATLNSSQAACAVSGSCSHFKARRRADARPHLRPSLARDRAALVCYFAELKPGRSCFRGQSRAVGRVSGLAARPRQPWPWPISRVRPWRLQ